MKLPPLVENGLATVGVGPGSTLVSISAGRNPRRGRRWGWKKLVGGGERSDSWYEFRELGLGWRGERVSSVR